MQLSHAYIMPLGKRVGTLLLSLVQECTPAETDISSVPLKLQAGTAIMAAEPV